MIEYTLLSEVHLLFLGEKVFFNCVFIEVSLTSKRKKKKTMNEA